MGIIMTREDGSTYKLYWAESNHSESGLCPKPEDLGDYFAWGETEPYYTKGHSQDNPCTDWREGKTGYYWDSYKRSNVDNYRLTRYCPQDKTDDWAGKGSPDNKTEFRDYDYADDAARAILKGKWRIPTRAEWDALGEQCTWNYINVNGVLGFQVLAKKMETVYSSLRRASARMESSKKLEILPTTGHPPQIQNTPLMHGICLPTKATMWEDSIALGTTGIPYVRL